MRHTENLGLSLYDTADKMNITGETESLNHNMQLLDAAIWDNKQNATFSQSARIALLNCFEKVAWSDESGRVLCEALREALNVSTSPDEYVTVGLELWFDGIKNTRNGHSATLSVWEDLSGNGHDMTCVGNTTGTSVKTAQCGNDHVIFDGSTVFYNNDNITSLTSLSPGTLEIVFEQENTDGLQVIFTAHATDSAKNIALWYRPSSGGYCIFSTNTGTSNAAVMNAATAKTNIAVTYADSSNYSVSANGDEITNFVSGGNIPCSKTISVGGKMWHNGDLYAFTGKIYAIRYYNRELTQEEIAQNLAVDKKRFGF